MKREIKFRGKRIDNSEWTYGYYFASQENNRTKKNSEGVFEKEETVHFISALNTEAPVFEVDPETVGEYTTFKINETEVYEGSRISYSEIIRLQQEHEGGHIEYLEPHIETVYGTVIFHKGCFCIETDHRMISNKKEVIELKYIINEDRNYINKDQVKEAIDMNCVFDVSEAQKQEVEDDYNFLIEDFGFKKDEEKQFLEFLNHIEIAGNIHETN